MPLQLFGVVEAAAEDMKKNERMYHIGVKGQDVLVIVKDESEINNFIQAQERFGNKVYSTLEGEFKNKKEEWDLKPWHQNYLTKKEFFSVHFEYLENTKIIRYSDWLKCSKEVMTKQNILDNQVKWYGKTGAKRAAKGRGMLHEALEGGVLIVHPSSDQNGTELSIVAHCKTTKEAKIYIKQEIKKSKKEMCRYYRSWIVIKLKRHFEYNPE